MRLAVMTKLPPGLRQAIAGGLPYALVLMLALGGVAIVGAHLANAFPSEKAPFGWDGPSSLNGAVATVRGDLVLAASLPALLMGARALARHEPARDGARSLLVTAGTHAALLAAACYLAGGIAAWGASRATMVAYLAFCGAHLLLALCAYALGFLWSAALREHAVAAAGATWLYFLGFHEGITRIILFRTVGYHALVEGQFPSWFYVAQAFSPLTTYRGTLILWNPRFMDALEKFTLGEATLPAWLVPATLASVALVLWVALPLCIGLLAWRLRARRLAAPVRRPARQDVA